MAAKVYSAGHYGQNQMHGDSCLGQTLTKCVFVEGVWLVVATAEESIY